MKAIISEMKLSSFFISKNKEGGTQMNVERFLFQVQQNLPKHEGVITWVENSALNVGYGKSESFEIRYPGGICYNAATEKTDEFYKLVEEADKTFKTVKEYIDLMDNAPELKATDFNMPYKLLAEFNGVVLGGIEHRSNNTFEFTTWSYGNNALYHGHYFTDYEKAKEDFVVRSGLLQSQKLFTDKEMMQIYRCTEDTLNNGYELSGEQIEVLEQVQEKIKESILNFDEKLKEEIDQECEEEMGMSMQ